MSNENLQTLIKIIGQETGVTEEEMKSKRRRSAVVWSRYIFCELSSRYLRWPDRVIYNYVNIDRTTLLHAFKKHHELIWAKDPEYTHLYNTIVRRLDIVLLPEVVEKISDRQLRANRIFNSNLLLGIDPYDIRNADLLTSVNN